MRKMAGRIILITFVFLVISSTAIKNPRDLADEAQEQLQELQSLVQGEILAAHDNLQNIETDFGSYSDASFNSGAVSIQLEQEQVNQQVETIKELGNSAGVDVTSCTDIREQVLNRLPTTYTAQIGQCIGVYGAEARRVTGDARYVVDITMTTVRNLEFQLGRCNGNLLCISPILTEIELDKVRLVQNIETEVLASGSLLTTMKVSVNSCSDDNVSGYTADAGSIVRDITACVGRLIG